MKQLNKLFVTALFILTSVTSQAQEIHFSQIFETALLRNPALAGLFKGDSRIQAVYRSQWSTVTVPYQTTSISAEFKKQVGNSDDYITIGGQILKDKAGTIALSTTELLPAFNYHKSISNEKSTYLSFGVTAGMVQKSLDRSKMTTNNQYSGDAFSNNLNDGETFTKPSYSYFDGTVGITLNSQIGESESNNYFVGLAYHHFNKPKKLSFYESSDISMSPKYVATAGVRFEMATNSYFTIQTDVTSQEKNKEVVGGIMYSWKSNDNSGPNYGLHLGTYFRWNESVIPVAKLEIKSMSIAVSYDANVSALKQKSNGNGGFELSLTYQKAKKDNSSIDAVKCPRF